MLSGIPLKIALVIILTLSGSSGGVKQDINFEGLELLEGDDILKFGIQIEKTGPSRYIANGTLTQLKLFDDNWKIRFEFSYVENYLEEPVTIQNVEEDGICEFLKQEYKKFFYESLKDYSNAPHYDTCPLEPNEYIVTNYPFNADRFHGLLLYGRYVVTIFIWHQEDLVNLKLKFSVHPIHPKQDLQISVMTNLQSV